MPHKGYKQTKEHRKKSSKSLKGKNNWSVGKDNPMWRKRHSKKSKEKQSNSKKGDKNPMWAGNKVSRQALHSWGHRYISKPKFCQDCKKVPPYDLANISQKYKRDITDWEWLCRRCHMLKDGRLNKFRKAWKQVKNNRYQWSWLSS